MITKDRFTAVVMTLFVWGLAGGVFGALFAGLYQVLLAFGLNAWQAPMGAAAASAMTTSALYSAMPVALTGAMAGVLASIGALIVLGQDLALPVIAGIAAAAGLAAGSFYAWMAQSGGRPLAETLTGLMSGLIAGGVLAFLVQVTEGQIRTFALAAGVVALVGTLFQISERWVVLKGAGLLPGSLSAALVAAILSSLVAASVWVLIGTAGFAADGFAQDAMAMVRHELPRGFLGGIMGGSITGVVLEILGFHLEDHELEDRE